MEWFTHTREQKRVSNTHGKLLLVLIACRKTFLTVVQSCQTVLFSSRTEIHSHCKIRNILERWKACKSSAFLKGRAQHRPSSLIGNRNIRFYISFSRLAYLSAPIQARAFQRYRSTYMSVQSKHRRILLPDLWARVRIKTNCKPPIKDSSMASSI